MPQGLDFSGTFLGAAVQWIGGAAGRRLAESVTGPPAQAALRRVVTAAIPAAVTEVTEEAHRHDVIDAVTLHLGQRPDTTPGDLEDPELILRRWLAPLDDPRAAGPDARHGYLRDRGVDPDRLVQALQRHILDGVRRNAADGGPLGPLWHELRARRADDELARMLAELGERSTARDAETLSRLDALTELITGTLGTGMQGTKAPGTEMPGGRTTQARAGGAATQIPRQLPPAPADFTGRSRELERLRGLCGTPRNGGAARTVVLTGQAGVGKTALALALAHALAGDHPDGQLYASLRDDRGAEAPVTPQTRFLRALGVPSSEIPDDPEEQAAAYRTALAGRRVVIVLDDAPQEAGVRPLLPGDGSCLTIVTSRNALPALEGATAFPLGLLAPDEAVRLLARAAGPGRVAESDPAAYAVVELCGRLPLAVRIAGARLRYRTDWAPETLAERLGDVRRRLNELRAGDLDVRTGFELSYRQLDEDAALFFRSLSASPGPTFSAGLGAALAGLPKERGEELMDRLLLDHLVEPAERAGMYTMHALLQLFAEEKWKTDDGDLRRILLGAFGWYDERLRRYSARLLGDRGEASEADTPVDEALAWVEAEEGNLLPLLWASNKLRFDEFTANFADRVVPLATYRDQPALGRTALDHGIAAARRLDWRRCLSRLLLWRGAHEVDHEAWEEAIATWAEAIRLTDPAEDPTFAFMLHYRLAYLYRRLGRTEDADREMAAFTELTSADSDTFELGITFFRAVERIEHADWPAAAGLLEPLLPTIEDSSVGSKVSLYLALAHVYRELGRRREERDMLLASRALYREYGLRSQLPQILLALGLVHRALGHHGKARKSWEEGLDAADTTGDHDTAARLLSCLGDERLQHGDARAATDFLVRSARRFALAGDDPLRAGVLDLLGQARLNAGDTAGARAAWEDACAALDRMSDRAWAEDRKHRLKLKIAGLRRRT